jgi:hypothetical protein
MDAESEDGDRGVRRRCGRAPRRKEGCVKKVGLGSRAMNYGLATTMRRTRMRTLMWERGIPTGSMRVEIRRSEKLRSGVREIHTVRVRTPSTV